MNPCAQALVESRDAICGLVAAVPAQKWEAVSPLTPTWKVREVLAHLVGVRATSPRWIFPVAT